MKQFKYFGAIVDQDVSKPDVNARIALTAISMIQIETDLEKQKLTLKILLQSCRFACMYACHGLNSKIEIAEIRYFKRGA